MSEPAEIISMNPAEAPKQARRDQGLGRFGRIFAVLFLTWTAAVIAWTIVPRESIVRRQSTWLFQPCRSITGLDQHWDMFGTVPHHHAYRVVVEVEPPGTAGARVKTGPILPGLGDVPAYFRYHTFFVRMEDPTYAGWLTPYIERLGAELADSHPEWRGGTFRVRKTAVRIQPLDTIRDLGEVGYEQSTMHGPFPIPDRAAGRENR